MRLSHDGAELMHRFEACRLEAYPDPKTGGDPWTIGWGHTGSDVHPGLVWTQEKADDTFMEDVRVHEQNVDGCVTVEVDQDQYDALVSIMFNVGPGGPRKDGIARLRDGRPSTLIRRLNAGEFDEAADQFLVWVSPGSNVERGLRFRRRCERAMFLGEDWRAEYAKGP